MELNSVLVISIVKLKKIVHGNVNAGTALQIAIKSYYKLIKISLKFMPLRHIISKFVSNLYFNTCFYRNYTLPAALVSTFIVILTFYSNVNIL